VSSTPATSSSVASSSVASSFATVTSITLAPAATDALTQVVGSLKTVVINASFNTGVNPDLRVSWLVNGVESKQTGRAFEFTPTVAGVFKIKARVGTVESQEQTVTVTAQGTVTTAVTITSHTFVSPTRLEVLATAGAVVTLTGATLDKTESFYDLEGKKYVLILDEALEQGDAVKVTLTKQGYTTAEQTFTFDTRKVELDVEALKVTYKNAITAGTVTLGADSITLVRPHVLAADGGINDADVPYFFPVLVSSIDGEEVNFSVTRLSAPAGAKDPVLTSGSVDIEDDELSTDVEININIERTTPLGDYVYLVTVGSEEKTITITVVDTTPTLELDDELEVNATTDTSFLVEKHVLNAAGNAYSDAVKSGVAEVGGKFEVTKDYLLAEVSYQEINFTFNATNINVPTNLLGTLNQPNNVNPNQILVSLAGPNGISFMRVDTTNHNQIPLPTPKAFRNEEFINVEQIVDSTTPVGDYVYTVRILQLGTEIHRDTVTVTVKDPTAKLSFTGVQTVPTVMDNTNVLTGPLYLGAEITFVDEDAPDVTGADGELWFDMSDLYELNATDDEWELADLTDGDIIIYFEDVEDETILFVAVYEEASTEWLPIESGYLINADLIYSFSYNDEDGFAVTNIKVGATPLTELNFFLDSISGELYEFGGEDWVTTDVVYSTQIPTIANVVSYVDNDEPTDPLEDGREDDEFITGEYWYDGGSNELFIFDGEEWDLVETANVVFAIHTDIDNTFDGVWTTYELNDGETIDIRPYTAKENVIVKRVPDRFTNRNVYNLFRANIEDIDDYLSINRLLAVEEINSLAINLDLANPLDVALQDQEGLLLIEGNVLKATELKDKETTLTMTGSSVKVTRPLRTTNDDITLNFSAVITNYQSPLNPTANIANSFTADINAAGIAGTRELLTFKKSYTGPQTIEGIVGVLNGEDLDFDRIALTNEVQADTSFDTKTDRQSNAAQETYVWVQAARNVATLENEFEFVIDSATTLGTYVFTMTVGSLTESFTVVVEAPKPAMELIVVDNIADLALTANTSKQYNLNLDISGDAELEFAIKLLNMQKTTTAQEFDYVLTRTFKFGDLDWTDTKTDTLSAEVLTGNDGNLFLVSGEGAFINVLGGTTSPTDTGSTLVLDETGTVTYKLVVNGATLEWSVVVKEFPTLEIVNAFLGDEDDIIDETPLAVFEHRADGNENMMILIEETGEYLLLDNGNEDEEAIEAIDTLHLQLRGVNLPTGVIHWALSVDDSNIPEYKANPLTFTNGVATIKLSEELLETPSNFNTDGFKEQYYIFLFNSKQEYIGQFFFEIIVNDFDNINLLD